MGNFEFYNISTDKEGHVEYIWQCQICGSLDARAGSDVAPEECDYCSSHPEED